MEPIARLKAETALKEPNEGLDFNGNIGRVKNPEMKDDFLLNHVNTII